MFFFPWQQYTRSFPLQSSPDGLAGAPGIGQPSKPPDLQFIYSEKATKSLRNLHLVLTGTSISQKKGKVSQKFCGLLRIYELYRNLTAYYVYFTSFYFEIAVKKEKRPGLA